MSDPDRNRIDVLGCSVDAVTLDQATSRICGWIEAGERRVGIAVNAHKLALRRDSSQVEQLLDTADLVFADGAPVVLAARGRLPQRVPGVDLATTLLARAEQHGWTVALLGGTDQVAARLEGPGRWTHHGFFEDPAPIVAQLRALDPDLLLVGMGSPRQEGLLVENPGLARFSLGVGGSLDVLAGIAERAPTWTHRVGLEGAWRIAQNPRQRWRRLLDLARMWPVRR